MKTLIKRLLKVLLVFSLFTSLSTTGSNAAPVDFRDFGNQVVTPTGDDAYFKLDGVTILFDGTVYTDVYINLNNVLSFGQGTTVYDEFPPSTLPAVIFNGADWTVDFEDGAQADEFMTADLTNGVLTITNSAIPYGSNPGNTVIPTVTVLTVRGVGGVNDVSFNYTVNGVSGPDYNLSTPRTGMRLGNGMLVGLNQYSNRGKYASAMVQTIAPKISQSGDKLTCTSGDFDLTVGSTANKANLSSVTYTLVVDGAEVSRVTAGNSRLPSHMLSSLTNLYAGSATTQAATFDMAGKTNYSASCNVMVTQGSTVLSANSETIADAASIAAKAKAASDAEVARQAALAEFNSKENRLKRMAKAAKAGN